MRERGSGGRVHHLDVKSHWVQERVTRKNVTVHQMSREQTSADAVASSAIDLVKHMSTVGGVFVNRSDD